LGVTHPRLTRAAPRDTQARIAAAEPFRLSLTDLDLHLLDVVCGLRVLTQTQLERLLPDIPPRTLRYRTQRLHRLQLVGRTRPYRNRGSAPFYLWPTNRADALIRGERPARRGERRPPNPLFLAHAAALSELFVVLRTRLPEIGLALAEFEREGQARKDFRDSHGGRRAIVPDARVQLAGRNGTSHAANVELDLGTMTHARLRMKLRSYLAHARWQSEAGAQPPALLFITTGQRRAGAFLAVARKLACGDDAALRLAIAASWSAAHLDALITTQCWWTADADRDVSLAACLQAAARRELLAVGAPPP
jgi:Replication-relaxation